MITGQTLRELIVAQGIAIQDRGHSVSRGNFNIQCPFCGAADGGHHMGIRLDNGWWACWRNAEHRGKSPIRLMSAILHKPVHEVRRILGIHSAPLLETFGGVRPRLEKVANAGVGQPPAARTRVSFPREFRPLTNQTSEASRPFREYMLGRGLHMGVWRAFDLHYAVAGDFANRVVLPYTYRGDVVTWTARSVFVGESLRYRDLDKTNSAIPKDELLYNYDEASYGGRALVLLEGQFDVLKGDWAGEPLQVRCVALGTNSITDAQLLMLADLAEGFDSVYIALDMPTSFAKMDSYRLQRRLRGVVDAEILDASSLGKDLGGATVRKAQELLRRIA